VSATPVGSLRPIDLILAGSSRKRTERRAGLGREHGLRLLLLIAAGSLVLAALLIAVLALFTGSPGPAPAPDPVAADAAAGPDFGIWAGSPMIDETPGDETARRPR
jgi:hypothetical protein